MATGIVRSIGGFEASVTVREQHRDSMTITKHPVERGAAITDHAFKMPSQLTIEFMSAATTGQSLSDIYTTLLTLQTGASPLSVQTGKRLYQNMLISGLSVTTDIATENILSVNAQLEEIILVDTLQTTMPSASVRATPQSTSGVTNTGTKSVTAYGP